MQNRSTIFTLTDGNRSLQADAGDLILLKGDCGSGKSRWLRHLAGLDPLARPLVLELVAGSKAERRIIFDQRPQLWLGQTVGEELGFGLANRPADSALQEILDAWGIGDIEPEAHPEHLNRLQGVRLALAAAALPTPDIICIDAVCDTLPQHEAERLTAEINAWCRNHGTAVVVASNRWHDWLPVATQVWHTHSADQLPQAEEQS